VTPARSGTLLAAATAILRMARAVQWATGRERDLRRYLAAEALWRHSPSGAH